MLNGAAFLLGFLGVHLFLPSFLDLLRRLGWMAANYRHRLLPCPGGLVMAVLWLVLAGLVMTEPAGRVLVGASAGVAGLGLIDDRYGNGQARGLSGHLRELLRGHFTTGLIKALGILILSFSVARLSAADAASRIVGGLVMALAANAFNLLDLAPGRAGKAFLAGNILLLPVVTTGALPYLTLGGILAYLPADLREKTMLGDTGSNLLGFLAGGMLVLAAPLWGEILALAVLAAMHLYAEKASFSRLIAAHPWLTFLDTLGRVN